MMVYKLTDDYGNYCIISDKELAEMIIKSGANPFNHMEKITGKTDEYIIPTYEDFINYFY